jgi:hypothetical protein
MFFFSTVVIFQNYVGSTSKNLSIYVIKEENLLPVNAPYYVLLNSGFQLTGITGFKLIKVCNL